MRSRSEIMHPISKIVMRGCLLAIGSAMLMSPWSTHAAGQQSIYLPDPTPRPPDLQRQYSDNPAQRVKEEQAAKLLNQLRQQQVTAATNTMLVLVQELKDQLSKREKDAPMAAELVKAEQIEGLAKKVKEVMKSR